MPYVIPANNKQTIKCFISNYFKVLTKIIYISYYEMLTIFHVEMETAGDADNHTFENKTGIIFQVWH